MHRIRRNLTYTNIVSVLVIVMSTSGLAWGATLYTGKQIADSSLTGLDFKDRSIQKRDLSAAAYASMRGRTGAGGATGTAGPAGPQGDTGDNGPMGEKAHSLVRFAWFHSPYLRTNPAAVPNPSPSKHWDAADYPTYAGANATLPNFTTDFPELDFATPITFNEPVVLQLTGENEGTTGTIRPTDDGLLMATATLTILHEHHGTTNHAGGKAIHGRMRCQLRYANNGEAISAGSPKLGAAEWLSSRRAHKVYTITLTGSKRVTADAAANYNVGVSCRDVDQTSSTQWTYVAGNVSAHAVYLAP